MRLRKPLTVIAIIAAAALTLTSLDATKTANATGTVPGSDADPVVTRSYVDKRIAEALFSGGTQQSPSQSTPSSPSADELASQIESMVKAQVQKAEGASFTPVSVEMGKTIYGGEGTEMILRSGAGQIVTTTDAVVNATTGADLTNGADAPKGNLLIFPRDDGRGVKATDACWFIVKGSYTIG